MSGPSFCWENRMGGFRKGGFSNNRFVLKPDVAIASEVSILSGNSIAIPDFHAKRKRSTFNYLKTPLRGTPPFAILNFVGSKNILQNSHQISRKISLQSAKTKFTDKLR